jgi:predicted MFS family arabinose efflux permease
MIKYPESKARRHLARTTSFRSVYLAMLALAFQGAVTLYVHSTYLERFVSTETVGVLFMVGAGISIAALLMVAEPLRRIGNLKLALGLIGVDALALLGMGLIDHAYAVVPLFVLHQALTPLLFFVLDIFLESLTGEREDRTGSRRGIILSLMSLANALAPLGAGLLMDGGREPDFTWVYAVSALLLAPLALYLYLSFRSFKDVHYTDVRVMPALRAFWHDTNLRYVFSAHFLLQLFFAWMVIYTPLYLATEIGFTWDEIGAIIFVGLLAYVLLEYPIGIVADSWLGEQEMMAVGFFVLGISTAWLSFVATAAVVPWMVAMFMTRVGASFVESTTESYFFKHAAGEDANVIGFFRITRPLAILVGAVLGSIALLLLPFQYIFAALGILMLLGIAFAALLVDTR